MNGRLLESQSNNSEVFFPNSAEPFRAKEKSDVLIEMRNFSVTGYTKWER